MSSAAGVVRFVMASLTLMAVTIFSMCIWREISQRMVFSFRATLCGSSCAERESVCCQEDDRAE